MLTLVLLPGIDGGGALFAPFIAALGDGVSTLVISYPPDQVLAYADLVDYARARLPVDTPFVLLGESFSGPVAIALAASRPPGLVAVILSCSFARNPRPALRYLSFLLPILPLSSSLSGLAAPLLLGRHSSAALRRAVRDALEVVALEVLRARLRAVLDVDYSRQLANVNVPVLYLQGSRDRLVPRSAAQDHGLAVVSLPGPHLLLQAMPDESAFAVHAFLNEVTGA